MTAKFAAGLPFTLPAWAKGRTAKTINRAMQSGGK